MIANFLDCDEMNFQTCESTDIELGEQENDDLLPDIRDDSGVGVTVYLRTNNFLWDDRDNYRMRKFCGISRPQYSAKGLTNTADTFEQRFDKDMVQKIATMPNR